MERHRCPATLVLGGLKLRKGRKGSSFGSCAIKADLTQRKLSVLSLKKTDASLEGSSRPWLIVVQRFS